MSEILNHYFLAESLGVRSQMLRDKILFHKKSELEQLGTVIDEPDGIALNIDQCIFLAMSCSMASNFINQVKVIKGLFGVLKEKIPDAGIVTDRDTISYEEFSQNLSESSPRFGSESSPEFGEFCRKLEHK